MRRLGRTWIRRYLFLPLLCLALVTASCTPDDDGGGEADDGAITLQILDNAVRGGKNAAGAEWILEYVIPTFEQRMADEGRDVTVELNETGIDDEDYKTQIALDLGAAGGSDIMGFDQFWVAEFQAGGLLEPLTEVVGAEVDDWEGWEQIPDAVQGSLELDGERYGIPLGTDGRVLFYNKDLFSQAGLPPDWQPTSWDEILDTARTLRSALPGVTPLQINAGVSMGEATTLQGFVPILLGTGAAVYDESEEKWLGDTPELREALGFYDTIYREGLANGELQTRADARDRSFQEFSQGTIAILAESDYLWRSVVAPDADLFPMANRDQAVGFAMIPARESGAGINGQDFVSASGGTGYVINPNTEHPEEAWELLQFLGSQEAVLDAVARNPRITAREDVNAETLTSDPLLLFIAAAILPITWYRPGFEEYPQVSTAIQEMVESVAAGRATVEQAAQTFNAALVEIVGGEDNVLTGS